MTRVVISGYYGFGNAGDEAVLAGILDALRSHLPNADVVVLSGNPTQTHRLHGVKATSRITGALRTLPGADLFISGGGSLIQDVTSARSALYYLGLLGLATVLAKATVVYAQGVGPLRRGWVRVLARLILARTTLITVRDEDSISVLKGLRIVRPVHLVADPAFVLAPTPAAQIQDVIGPPHTRRIGVAIRSWRDDAFVDALVEGLRAARRRIGETEIVVLALHPERDLVLCTRVAQDVGGRVLAGLSPRDLMAVVGTMDLLVGGRLHALIASVLMGVPPIGLSYDPKIDGFVRRIGMGRPLSLAGLRSDDLCDAVCATWEERETLRPRLREHAVALREGALRAAGLTRALLVSPHEAPARRGNGRMRPPKKR
ncbi:MAG TPA: polysaccharide pyruvyl transferase CsaB [bacterium]|nr:polysaccharide pyruvyl transferase CsaB [bacterium]